MARRSSLADDFADYTIELTGWEWGFSFGLNPRKADPERYMEFRHVELRGNVLGPKTSKCTRAVVSLLPNLDYNERDRADRPAGRAVGGLDSRDGTLHGGLSLPHDALGPILTVLAAQRFRLLVMHGTRLRYRQALVRSYRLETRYNREDFPID